jgi:N-acetylneuraminate synthase/N,N'-diacetyllegionaminate synthase
MVRARGAARRIGDGEPCFIIAEAGVNHNGELALAKRLVDAAKRAGADAVKFQTFRTDEIVTRRTKKAKYQTRSRERTHQSMLRRLELPFEAFEELKAHCDARGIEFMSTPYDPESAAFLDGLGVARFKVGSGDLTNRPLIEAVAGTGKQVILSTGMATMEEVERTVRLVEGKGNRGIVLLHCVTSYPAPADEVNLSAMWALRMAFGYPVGYSDHTVGNEVAIMAVAMGANVIEKHLTLDRGMVGPDHFASAEPDEMADLVRAVRNVELAFGDGIKRLSRAESANVALVRRSLHARRPLGKGARLRRGDLKVTRPADGIESWDIGSVVGRRLARRRDTDDPIRPQDLEPR